jgi:hypothetical protein
MKLGKLGKSCLSLCGEKWEIAEFALEGFIMASLD